MGNIKFEHIRNATSKITCKGITFLIDPMLAPKDAYPGFEGTYNNHLRFPLVDLPNSIMEILKGVKQKTDVSNLILELKAKRDRLLDLE